MKKYLLKFNFMLSIFLSSWTFGHEVDLDTYQALVSDVKSYAVGEPIVVIVVESTLAEASAGTGIETNRGISAKIRSDDNGHSAGMDIDTNSEGAGKTSRKGRVTTQLSATIDEIFENGMLKIRGNQDILINGESQRVIIRGIVRASDISKNNSVFSYQIANVELEITGDGEINKAQKQNIIYRVLNWLGVL